MVNKKHNRVKRIKDKVLRFMAYVNAVVFLIATCTIDSDSWIPFFICCISLLYLGLYGLANELFYEEVNNWDS